MKKKLLPILICLLALMTALSPCAFAFLHGDANLDGNVTAGDARFTLRAAVGLETAASYVVPIADCDNDMKLTTADARAILRASIQLEEIPCLSFLPVTTGTGVKQICAVCGKERGAVIPTQTHTPTPVLTPTPVSETLRDASDRISRYYGATGVQAAVIDGGSVSGVYNYGLAKLSPRTGVSEDTKFRVASLSKLVVSMVFMALADRGYVSDQTDIGQYLGKTVRNPYYPNTPITAEMIMTHTGSFDDEGFYTYDLSRLDTTDDDIYYYFRPGSVYVYSNLAYGLLWCACEKATGKTFDALAKQYLFDPLGIDAAFSASQIRAQSQLGELYGEDGGLSIAEWKTKQPNPQIGSTLRLACGNLGISAKDYAKLLCVLLNGGKAPNGTQLLTRESVNSICRSHFREDFYGVGYGTQIETTVLPGKTVMCHTGSAYGMFAAYTFCPAENKGVVVLTTGCDRSLDRSSEIYNVCLDLIRTLYPD